MISWDETKRQARKHGLDFAGAEAIFDHYVFTVEDVSEAYGEQRFNVLGWLVDRVVHLTCTDDGEALRIISLREAEKHEARKYFEEATR